LIVLLFYAKKNGSSRVAAAPAEALVLETGPHLFASEALHLYAWV